MERTKTSLPEIHPEVVAYILHELDDDEREEFLTGLRPLFHTAVDVMLTSRPARDAAEALITELLAYLESWRLSLVVHRNESWQRQVDESAELWEAGSMDDIGSLRETAAKLAS